MINFYIIIGHIKKFKADNVEKIGNNFICRGIGDIEELNLPKVKKIGNEFLSTNRTLKSISAPNLETCGMNFIAWNQELERLDLPKCKTINKFFNIKEEWKYTIDLAKKEFDAGRYLEGITSMVLSPLQVLMEATLHNLSSLIAPPLFLETNQKIKSIKLPKTLTSILIRRNIRKRNLNCEVELIDDQKQRNKKRNIKKPKLLSQKLIGSKQIAELDSDQKLTSSEVNKGKRIIDRVVEIFKGKNNEKQEK